MNELRFSPPKDLANLQNKALIVGIIGLAASLGGFLMDSGAFYEAWLVGSVFTICVPIGCLSLLMVHHLSRGAWGIPIRRIFEAGSRTLWLNALFVVPLYFGMHHLYHWTHADAVAHDPILQGKALYLNTNGFFLRAAIAFIIWGIIAWRLTVHSRRQDGGDEGCFHKMQRISAPGILILGLTGTFISVDWLMSLDPHWFSSLYGLMFLVGCALSGMAFATAMITWLAGRAPMNSAVEKLHLHDYGKLIFAFLMLWGYLAVSQLIIIWNGNLPEDITWYIPRLRGEWTWLTLVVVVAHFALPFVVLLSRDIKRNAGKLMKIALFVLMVRWVEIFWNVAPTLRPDAFDWTSIWIYFATVVGTGGLWFYFFIRSLRSVPLIPICDPYITEAFGHGHH